MRPSSSRVSPSFSRCGESSAKVELADCRVELAVSSVLLTSDKVVCTPGKIFPLNCIMPLRSSTRLPSRLPAIRSIGSLLILSTMDSSFSCNCSRLPGMVGIMTGRAFTSKATLSVLG
ncbi:hypothetical protein D3C78_1046410 [compost metagenome]